MFPVYNITHPQEHNIRYSTQGYLRLALFSPVYTINNFASVTKFVQIGCGFILKQWKRKIRPPTPGGESKTGASISLYTVQIII